MLQTQLSNSSVQAAVMTSLLSKLPKSALADHPSVDRSDKYRFYSSTEYAYILESLGWTVTKSGENKTRKEEHKGFQKHMITFRNAELERAMGEITREVVPQFLLKNAHNGTSALDIRMGLYRFVCMNGMVVGEDWARLHVIHKGAEMPIAEAIIKFSEGFGQLFNRIEGMKRFGMSSQAQKEKVVELGVQARYPSEGTRPIVSPEIILRPRRQEDGSTLWGVFNTVQENLTKGRIPVQTRSAAGGLRRSTMRRIGSVGVDYDFNKRFWASVVQEFMA